MKQKKRERERKKDTRTKGAPSLTRKCEIVINSTFYTRQHKLDFFELDFIKVIIKQNTCGFGIHAENPNPD